MDKGKGGAGEAEKIIIITEERKEKGQAHKYRTLEEHIVGIQSVNSGDRLVYKTTKR
jgi:hypothetical protein